MDNPPFLIRRTRESDWREVRDLRLEMLRDTPLAFSKTYETALEVTEGDWRLRAARGTAQQGTAVAAITGAGTWVGTMAGTLEPGVGPLLISVYVSPAWRGYQIGLTTALLTEIEDWARSEGGQLTLHVHQDNGRAIAFYERQGFKPTGRKFPNDLYPGTHELEMVKSLTP
ncbi:GNAT family N-acetyltransferase [Jonesiaceae bacterium BS-20]|uniref:GNAT family N-acetyltransferase n=1 Tax=Jonesiaceae bacterium BS-20 TaxID=3120821 RepID=A0AAU7DUW2_9MICO